MRTTGADSILQELSTRPYPPSYDIALIYLSMGKKDRGIESLQRAYEERNDQVIWVRGDPRLGQIRSDSRVMMLIKKLGLEK